MPKKDLQIKKKESKKSFLLKWAEKHLDITNKKDKDKVIQELLNGM
jgi:hypothetical protein